MAALVVSLVIAPMLTLALDAEPVGAADSTSLLTWSRLGPAASPPARVHAAMAFDPATNTTVVFGGRSGTGVLADTWTWNGSTWSQQSPPASPPALESASMAYDNVGHLLVLFGGLAADGTTSGATWAWNGDTWIALAPATMPRARYGASMAADALTGTDVLFGGLSAPGTFLSDTWSWNGTDWALNLPTATPPARSGAAMTFDGARGLIVLFGGTTGGSPATTGAGNQADTWTFDGSNWTARSPATSPPARSDAAFGFDDGTQTAVLFGGRSATSILGDTWLWNGSTWSTSLPLALAPILSPPGRIGASMAAAPAPQYLVLFGGQPVPANPGAASGAVNDTWTFAAVLPIPTDPPTTAPATSTTVGPPSTPTPTTGPLTTAPHVQQPPTAPATPRPQLSVAHSSVHGGQSVTVSGSGFVPGATITITFQSPRVVVGTIKADGRGHFTATVQVPADAPPGKHNLQADGPANVAGGHAVLVAQVRIPVPGAKHSWVLPASMVALTVLLAAGAGVVLIASTRHHHQLPT